MSNRPGPALDPTRQHKSVAPETAKHASDPALAQSLPESSESNSPDKDTNSTDYLPTSDLPSLILLGLASQLDDDADDILHAPDQNTATGPRENSDR